MNLLENLPIELFYKILDFLDIIDIKNILLLSNKIFKRIMGYNINLIFVNNKEKINYFFIYTIEYLIKNKKRIINKLEIICNNDFIELDFNEKVYINYINRLDIIGIFVYNYYISYIKGINFYVLPKFKDVENLILDDHLYYPEYQIYFENDIKLKEKIKKYIIPNKNYKNIKFNYFTKDLINSNLIS